MGVKSLFESTWLASGSAGWEPGTGRGSVLCLGGWGWRPCDQRAAGLPPVQPGLHLSGLGPRVWPPCLSCPWEGGASQFHAESRVDPVRIRFLVDPPDQLPWELQPCVAISHVLNPLPWPCPTGHPQSDILCHLGCLAAATLPANTLQPWVGCSCGPRAPVSVRANPHRDYGSATTPSLS